MKDNEVHYINAMKQAKLMLESEMITIGDYQKIELKMAEKYSLNNLSLIRANDLLYIETRAIYMIPIKEVTYGENYANSHNEKDA